MPGYETTDAGFFSFENLPDLSTPRNTSEQIEMMFSFKNNKMKWPFIDINN